MSKGIIERKDAHLEIAASGRGEFLHKSTLLEEVQLVHQALPELALCDIDLSTELFGQRLSAPILVGAMTGGTVAGEAVNEDLARLAAELGLGFCLGSQRVMAEHGGASRGFDLGARAPLLVGNIGLVQVRELGVDRVVELAREVGAAAMAVHLNVAQELVQPGGDRDFGGCIESLAALAAASPVPIVAKETGCGLSREAGEAIVRAGVSHVEVAGAGGTSFVRVEAERSGAKRWLGELLSEWGVPTAASLVLLEPLPLVRIAGGGLRDALDLARAMALGASACAVAQPVLVAYREGGADGARRYLGELIEGLRAICLLTGCATPSKLAFAPRVVGPALDMWREAGARNPSGETAVTPRRKPGSP